MVGGQESRGETRKSSLWVEAQPERNSGNNWKLVLFLCACSPSALRFSPSMDALFGRSRMLSMYKGGYDSILVKLQTKGRNSQAHCPLQSIARAYLSDASTRGVARLRLGPTRRPSIQARLRPSLHSPLELRTSAGAKVTSKWVLHTWLKVVILLSSPFAPTLLT